MRIWTPVSLLCCSLMLQACDPANPATNAGSDIAVLASKPGKLSPEQAALREREKDYASARIQGSAAGAGLGLVACLLLDMSAAECAGVIAGGAVAGYTATAYTARDRETFTADQATLQADIEQARKDNEALAKNVAAAEKVLAYQKTEVATMKAGIASGQVSLESARAQYRTMEGDVKAVQDLRTKATERLAALQQYRGQYAAAGLPTKDLQSSEQYQAEQIKRLKRVEDAMIGVIDSVPKPVAGS
jgi:hypothetical protein